MMSLSPREKLVSTWVNQRGFVIGFQQPALGHKFAHFVQADQTRGHERASNEKVRSSQSFVWVCTKGGLPQTAANEAVVCDCKPNPGHRLIGPCKVQELNIAVDGVLMFPDREPSGSAFKAQSSADIQLTMLHSTKENPRGAHIVAPRFDTC